MNLEKSSDSYFTFRTEGNVGADVSLVQIDVEDMEETTLDESQEFSERENREVPVPSPSTSTRVQKKSKYSGKSDVDKVISFLKLNSETNDDLEYFFKSMCETTRKLPVFKQIQLRRQINELVLSAQEEVMLQESTMSNQAWSSSNIQSPHSWSSSSVHSNPSTYHTLTSIHHQNEENF